MCMLSKLEEMQKTVARLSLGDDDNTAKADQDTETALVWVGRPPKDVDRIGGG